MTGKSLEDLLMPENDKPVPAHRSYILTGRERHTHARPDNLGYPARAIRDKKFLYIENLKPYLWPAGDPPPHFEGKEVVPPGYKEIGEGYNDIDDGPTKTWLIDNRDEWPEYFEEGYAKRPAEQLYDLMNDPSCMHNLAGESDFDSIRTTLKSTLEEKLTRQGDPRMLGYGDIFDSYPRFAPMRNFPGFKKRGEYNPEFQIKNE